MSPVSLNQFAYGAGSPITYVDPTGTCHTASGNKDRFCDADGDDKVDIHQVITDDEAEYDPYEDLSDDIDDKETAIARTPPPRARKPELHNLILSLESVYEGGDVNRASAYVRAIAKYYGETGVGAALAKMAAIDDAEQSDVVWQLYHNSPSGWQAVNAVSTVACVVPWYGCVVAAGGVLTLQEIVVFAEANRGPGFDTRQFWRDTTFNVTTSLPTLGTFSRKRR